MCLPLGTHSLFWDIPENRAISVGGPPESGIVNSAFVWRSRSDNTYAICVPSGETLNEKTDGESTSTFSVPAVISRTTNWTPLLFRLMNTRNLPSGVHAG